MLKLQVTQQQVNVDTAATTSHRRLIAVWWWCCPNVYILVVV